MNESKNQEINQAQNLYYTTHSVIQLRLDTEKVLSRIDLYIRGSTIAYQEDQTGKIVANKVSVGKPKANDEGVQSILSYVSAVINPQTVQGNFSPDEYYDYLTEVNIDLVYMLVNNCYTYKIREEDIEPICDFIMKIIIPFMSRLIQNKERESYANTIKHMESNTLQSKGAFSLFRK